jgi:hypothetical protein
MNSFAFIITPEAVQFIRRVLFSNAKEDLVLAIAPESDATIIELGGKSISHAIEEAVTSAREGQLFSDPSKLQYQWVVGASERARFPAEDVFDCNGIPCFLPHEMREIVNGRTLVVQAGELRLVPEPPGPRQPRG